jgi:chromosome segregation ATPase
MNNPTENLELRTELEALYERLEGRDQDILGEAIDLIDQLEVDLSSAQDQIGEHEETIYQLEEEIEGLRAELDELDDRDEEE